MLIYFLGCTKAENLLKKQKSHRLFKILFVQFTRQTLCSNLASPVEESRGGDVGVFAVLHLHKSNSIGFITIQPPHHVQPDLEHPVRSLSVPMLQRTLLTRSLSHEDRSYRAHHCTKGYPTFSVFLCFDTRQNPFCLGTDVLPPS